MAHIQAHLSPNAVVIPAANISALFPGVVAVMEGDSDDDQECWQCGARGWAEDGQIDGRWWCKGCAKIEYDAGRSWPLLDEAYDSDSDPESFADEDD